MAIVRYKEILMSNLSDLPRIEGQLIYCPDTKKSYYDGSGDVRFEILNIVILETESDRISTISPVKSRIYVVQENEKVYRHTGLQWIEVTETIQINDITKDQEMIVPVKLEQGGQQISPEVLSSSIRTEEGLTLDEVLAAAIQTSRIGLAVGSVTAQSNMQRSFEIPFPFPDYLRMGNSFLCILGMSWVDPIRYTISGNKLVFNDPNDGVGLGRKLSFIFIFNSLDPTNTELQAVDGSYIADGSIPITKLEDSVRLALSAGFTEHPIELQPSVTISASYPNGATYHYGGNRGAITLHLDVVNPDEIYTGPIGRIPLDMVPKIPVENVVISTNEGPVDVAIDHIGNIWLGATMRPVNPSRIDGVIHTML